MQPMYDCSVQVFGSEHLGKAYAVLAKRRAQIRKEDWKEVPLLRVRVRIRWGSRRVKS